MRIRTTLRLILAATFSAAGILHFVLPAYFLGMMPDWVPLAPHIVALSGVVEIAGAAGLVVPRLRQAAGIGLALYAICVFPANIQHAMDWHAVTNSSLGWLYHGPRLLAQPVIVWLCLWASGAIDWPFRRQAA